ncbi:MAG: FtsH protease activity modulator HflK [Nanoarchaeota archaeon]|nr:FtsH protease activity modulator HflK [Nanoarchaeota archaeon]
MVLKEFLERIDDEGDRNLALRGWKWIKRGLLGTAAVVGLVTSLYTVPLDSHGVVRRFGEYSRTAQPGIHMKIPFGIESVVDVPVKRIQKEEFGFRTLEAGVNSKYLGIDENGNLIAEQGDVERFVKDNWENVSDSSANDYDKAKEILRREYIMLTGDLNIADVEWIVQYNIKDAKDYLFNVKDVKAAIRDCSQAVMRQIVGNGSVDEAITIGRIDYENRSKIALQELLDDYRTGIQVVTVKMQSSNPPMVVRPAFNEVNKAQQQKEQRINEALKAYNEVVPQAKGEARQTVEEAKGYAAERTNRAKGDVQRFAKVLEEYERAPEITAQRMYLETMGKTLPQIPEKWIIDGTGDRGYMLKLLNLNQPQNEK